MANISFTVQKKLALYVAKVVKSQGLDSSINTAIAKACIGVNDRNANVTITITEDDVVSIYQRLTNMPEGVAMQPNATLSDVLTPLLGAHPSLAQAIGGIVGNNIATRTALEDEGEEIIERIQQSILNN